MSHTIPIEEAASQLEMLVRALGPEDEIVLTDNNKPIARIVSDSRSHNRVAGTCKGMIEIVDENDDGDDVILEHFKGYLP